MSQLLSQSSSVTLGFLTVLQESSGWLGGYLVTNGWGRPLEFRLTTAVQPNRVQAALYGPTLHEYLFADLIGKTLVEKTAAKPDLIVTDTPAALPCGRGSRCRWCRSDRNSSRSPLTTPPLDHPRAPRGLLLPALFATDRDAVVGLLDRVDPAVELGRTVRADPRRHRRGAQDGGDEPCSLTRPLPQPLPQGGRVFGSPPLPLGEGAGGGVRAQRSRDAATHGRSLGALVGADGVDDHQRGVEVPARRQWTSRSPDSPRHAGGRHEVRAAAIPSGQASTKPRIRPKPTSDTVLFKDRLLCLLQPPLDGLFDGRQLQVQFEPFPYQLEGIAFLMPRAGALLADEMGLGKTAQAILAMRLLFHQGLIRQALVVCPKPLVHNWARELKMWAPDVPFETMDGDAERRRTAWLVSNCPLKLVNYETLTRDADLAADPRVEFDLVVLDEAQRIKNRESKTAQVVRALNRDRGAGQ